MKWTYLNARQKEIIEHNSGLSHYLRTLTEEVSPTPRSWLYESKPADEVLNAWINRLQQVCERHPYGEKIIQFDLKQREKFGPQGGHPPLMQALELAKFDEMFEDHEPSIAPSFRTLPEIVGPRLKNSVRLKQLGAVIEDMRERDTLETNSGWPLFTKRSTVAQEMIERAHKTEAAYDPAIILFRTYNGKTRMVWMYPMAANLLEFQSTQPLQKALQTLSKYVTPWKGFEDVKVRFTELWAKHGYAFGGDTTQMDAHMQRPQINAVGDMISPCFITGRKQTLFWLQHVTNIGIVVSPDYKVVGHHGVASGSGWTQLSETIFQLGIFDEFIRAKNLPLTTEDGMGIGDDYVWFFNEKPDSEEIVKFWEDRGLPGKPEKQSNEDDSCTFLQRLFIKGVMSRERPDVLAGIYPTVRALNSLIFPERFHDPRLWNSDMFCIRTYQILENCVDHPAFEEFVKFVVAGQKDLIPFAKKSERHQNGAQAFARAKLPGLVPTYNQEKRDKPLSSYASIAIAKEL